MAVTQTGTTLQFSIGATTTGTVSSTITVPSDAEFVVVGISDYYSGAGNNFSGGSMTFTKGGVDTSMTAASNLGNASTSASQAAMFYLALPDTGTNKSLKWSWPNAPTQPLGIVSVTFWLGNDTSSPVRSTSGGQSTTTPPYTTGTLTAQSGDLIIAFVGAYIGVAAEGSINSWSNLTTLTNLTALTYSGSDKTDGAWATGSPSGNTTVAASTHTNYQDGGIVAIVVKPAAVGDTLFGNCEVKFL